MVFKASALFIAVAIISQVSCEQAIIEERLDDRTVTHITNPLIGVGISIPHLILDTLEACIVDFPNGITYEVFPNSNLPNTVSGSGGVFPACSISFRGVSVDMSGTYELTALTSHWDGTRTLRKQRFHMTFIESELEW